jgi:hypothetical protein
MEAAEITCPKLGEAALVSTPAYCTVLKTLFAVARNSVLRVPPSCIVLERDILFWTVPGPAMELRETLPQLGQSGVVELFGGFCECRGVEPLFQRTRAGGH